MTETTDGFRNGLIRLEFTSFGGLFVDLEDEILPALANLTEATEVGGLEY